MITQLFSITDDYPIVQHYRWLPNCLALQMIAQLFTYCHVYVGVYD